MSKLVIVESPAKAKTIKKYLGKDYEVMASMGHVRDLPKNSLGVNVDKDFRPQYLNISGKEKLIKELQDAAKKSDFVYLATDPDREGEAISWHLAHLLKLPLEEKNRVTFGEITQKGVRAGMDAPRSIDLDLVDSQQARRILDRIVGYKLSPFLWRKVRRGLSAGRVQSVAVRLIVDRERAIEAFVPQEFWTIDAVLRPSGMSKTFTARLRTKQGVEPDAFKLENKEQADAVLAALETAEFSVKDIKKGVRRRVPEPPFITSTLQQDASRRLGFTARRTMRAAQELYEGVDIEDMGSVGLITYMRTDSLRVSDDAVAEANEHIVGEFGEKYVCRTQRTYKRKSASTVQDAHEAIRPSSVALTPARVKESLTADQYKLYKLIWERFVASRMSDQVLDTMTVDLQAGEYIFRATGHTVVFDGFTKLYEAATDEKSESAAELPPLELSTVLRKKEIKANQRFTQPPLRFSEATLIKALEENGIGRPSTYAPIISTIIDRGYVEREQRSLKPTALGTVVTDLMIDQFPNIVDEKFSAGMEKNLDKIEEGKTDWVKTLDKFYKDFAKTLKKAEENLDGQRLKVPEEETDIVCELCGRKMVIKTGRYGKFLACPGFPECRNTKKIVVETPGLCPKCGGKILVRRSQKGRVFYACEKGKECGFMSWDEPVAEKCPQCGSSLFKKKGKTPYVYCQKEGCGYRREEDK
ncbi:MAG: type I DNA topoisomerase [Oscillospiraceae bacterium]|nr:type I DNA topoisomerase [Oscillospiraceae bacterium]